MSEQEREFYRTTVTLTFLSDRPTDDLDLTTLVVEADMGDMVGRTVERKAEKIDGKAMADALWEADSEPGFFGLDDDGNPDE